MTESDLQFEGKANAGNPNGDDLIMTRSSGNIRIWNEYWAFGGGQPTEDEFKPETTDTQKLYTEALVRG